MRALDYYFDKPASGEGRYSQFFMTLFLWLCRLLGKPLFRYKGAGMEVVKGLKPGQGALLAGNHRSYLDPLFILLKLQPTPVRFMCKEEFFEIAPIVSYMAAWVGAYPVKRESADMSAVKRSIRMLRRGELVGIFPEGTRIRHPDQEVSYHEGVALIATMADVPVIPVRIFGTDRIKPLGTRFFRAPQVSLRFGEPLSISDEPFASLPKDERYAAFTAEVMRRVYELEPLPGTVQARLAEAGAGAAPDGVEKEVVEKDEAGGPGAAAGGGAGGPEVAAEGGAGGPEVAAEGPDSGSDGPGAAAGGGAGGPDSGSGGPGAAAKVAAGGPEAGQ